MLWDLFTQKANYILIRNKRSQASAWSKIVKHFCSLANRFVFFEIVSWEFRLELNSYWGIQTNFGLVPKYTVFMVSLQKLITECVCSVLSISAISKTNFLVKMFMIWFLVKMFNCNPHGTWLTLRSINQSIKQSVNQPLVMKLINK